MRNGAGIEMVGIITAGEFEDFAHLTQQGKIAVNGAKADIRKFLPDVGIYHVRGRMVFSGGKKILNGFSLPAVF